MDYKPCFMMQFVEFGSIKSTRLKPTKNNFLRLFVLFTGNYTGSVNSLLGTSIKAGLCSLTLDSEAFRATATSVVLL